MDDKITLAIIDSAIRHAPLDKIAECNSIEQIKLKNSVDMEFDSYHCETILNIFNELLPVSILKNINILIISVLDKKLETKLSLVKKAFEIAFNANARFINFSIALYGEKSKKYFHDLFASSHKENTDVFSAYSIDESYPSHLKQACNSIDKFTFNKYKKSIDASYIKEIIDLKPYNFIPVSTPSFSVPVALTNHIIRYYKEKGCDIC
jgi:hypothetical protein